MIYPVRTPWLFRKMYSGYTWSRPSPNKVYLSFDDGPHPDITAFVLDQLRLHGAKATFFCIGDNVVRYPDMYRRILADGHAVGNHTQHHVNGWHTDVDDYVKDVRDASAHIASTLFRPPYGRIRKAQAAMLQGSMKMEIVMWSVLSGDFDRGISPAKCADNVLKKIRPGDIVVFHDSEKAFDRLQYALPLVLEHIGEQQWVAEKL